MLHTYRRVSDAAAQWRSLDPTRTLANRPEWLKSTEDPSGESVRYAIYSSESGVPEAGIAIFRVSGDMFQNYDPIEVLLHFPEDAHRHVDPDIAARLTAMQAEYSTSLREILRPAAVSMLPAAYLSGIIRTGQNSEAIAGVLDALDEAAEGWQAGCTAVMHVPSDDELLDKVLRDRGYVSCLVTAQCVLPVPGRSFEDYLRGLKSDRRRKVLRERRVFLESGLRTRWAGAEVLGPDMARLQAEQLGRYGHDISADQMLALIDRIKTHFSEACRVLVAERDDRLEAFVLSYVDDRSIYPKMVGWSEYARKHYAYFNLGYYEQITYAAEHGLSEVVVGPESYDAKVPRHCMLQPRRMYIRAGESVMRSLGPLTDLLDRVHRSRLGAYDPTLS